MTACPLAVWDPLGPQTAYPMSRHDIVCLHTMAGPFDVVDRMFHEGGYSGTESHFGVRGDGFAKQWQDLDFRADANNEGNHRIISIETADMGESFATWSTPNVPAWTGAQLDKIVALVRWCCDRYDIPKQLVPDSKPGRRGIAYHRQGIPGNFPPPYTGWVPGGELWTVLPRGRGKPCPGDRRIRQLIEIVIPRVNGDDMPLDETDKKFITNAVNKAAFKNAQRVAQLIAGGQGNTLLADEDGNQVDWAAGRVTLPKVLAAVAGIDVDVDEVALAAAVAPLLSAQVRDITDADLAAIAAAVNDEQHRRSAS